MKKKTKKQPVSKKSHQFSDSAFKSHIILTTYGMKKVNKKLLAAHAISRVALLPWVWGNEMRGSEELINSYTSVAFHALPATSTVCTKGTEHQIVNTSLQRDCIQTLQPWKETLASERMEDLINSAHELLIGSRSGFFFFCARTEKFNVKWKFMPPKQDLAWIQLLNLHFLRQSSSRKKKLSARCTLCKMLSQLRWWMGRGR